MYVLYHLLRQTVKQYITPVGATRPQPLDFQPQYRRNSELKRRVSRRILVRRLGQASVNYGQHGVYGRQTEPVQVSRVCLRR